MSSFLFQDDKVECFCFIAGSQEINRAGLKPASVSNSRNKPEEKDRARSLITIRKKTSQDSMRTSLKREKIKPITSKPKQIEDYTSQQNCPQKQISRQSDTNNYQLPYSDRGDYIKVEVKQPNRRYQDKVKQEKDIRPIAQVRNYYNSRYNYHGVALGAGDKLGSIDSFNQPQSPDLFPKNSYSPREMLSPQLKGKEKQSKQGKNEGGSKKAILKKSKTNTQGSQVCNLPVRMKLKEIQSVYDDSDEVSEVVGRGWGEGFDRDFVLDDLKEIRNTLATSASQVKNSLAGNSYFNESLMKGEKR